MPLTVYLLAVGIFAMVTSEFTVSGLMPQLAASLAVSVSQIGYLVTGFALAMSVGGPVLAIALRRWAHKRALLLLLLVFFLGNAIAAVAVTYPMMMTARVITGAAAGAFFGIALTAAGRVVPAEQTGRAIAAALQGLMLGTTLGLPMATLVGGLWGWRSAFVAIGIVTVVAAGAIAIWLPAGTSAEQLALGPVPSLKQELWVFRSWRLWGVMATSTLIIASVFIAFSYFSPILQVEAGIDLGFIPLLLLCYGLATIVGNTVVGRLAWSFTLPVLIIGGLLNAGFLILFAVFAQLPWLAIAAMLGIGLVGVTMNPAMVTRVQRVGNADALVNTVHTSMITLGVAIGSTLGGIGIAVAGLRAPLWLGALLALIAVGVMVPSLWWGRQRPNVPEPDAAGEFNSGELDPSYRVIKEYHPGTSH